MDANITEQLERLSSVDVKKFSRQLREILLVNSSTRLHPEEDFFIPLIILFDLLDAIEDAPKESKLDLLPSKKQKQKQGWDQIKRQKRESD